MPHIVDKDTEIAVVSIIVCVFPFFDKTTPYDNVILKDFLDHENYYKDKLLNLGIRGSMYRLDKCMQTIGCLIKNSETENYFNHNDIGIIIDIGLRELSTPNAVRARV